VSDETLADLIANLPEEERIVLSLYYVKSMSTVDIAATLKVPERAIHSVLMAGKARLRASLPFDFT
jgi:DNA-directed RNA polymerase specialized sigma24 family protein